jgi:septum formation protein
MQVVLASASPRRQELLKKLFSEFLVDPAHVDEDAMTLVDPFATAELLAQEKALAVLRRHPGALVIGGDTVVAYESAEGWQQLAKPQDPEDAIRMLSILQGRSHVVATGISLQSEGIDQTFHERTRVFFRPVGKEEIVAYVATGESMDKAGAYGAQGMASTFVEKLEGPISNVIGLPIERLAVELEALGIQVLPASVG